MNPLKTQFSTLSAISLVVVTAGLSACSEEQPAHQSIVRPVQYAQAQSWDKMHTEIFSGQTRANIDKELSFKVAGTILERPVDVGSQVKAGDLIAKLDARDYRIASHESNAALAAAKAEQRNADAEYNRVSELYEDRNSSKAQLDAARAAADSARANVRAARERLRGSQLQLSYTELTSPEHCVVAQTFADVNENVSAGQPVIRINCGSCAEIEISVPAAYIDKVTSGMPIKVTVDALPDKQMDAAVTHVGVISGGAAFTVKAVLQGECPVLRSGMAANAHFLFSTQDHKDGLVTVPLVSVGEDKSGRFVFVLEKSTGDAWTAKRRVVEVGYPIRSGIIIKSGIKTGEHIATAGVRRLRDGQTVSLLPQSSGS